MITRNMQDKHKNSIFLDCWDMTSVQHSQLSDESIGPIMSAKEPKKERPTWGNISAHLKMILSQWDRLELHNGVLYRHWEGDNNSDTKIQLILPSNMRAEVLNHCHDAPTGGHLGEERTLSRVKGNLYWLAMKEYIQSYCRQSDALPET